MKRIISITIPAALLALAGCGGDTCSSGTVPVSDVTGGCATIAANQPVTISLHTCPSCSDQGLACSPDLHAVQSGTILLDSVAQQCQVNCGTGCSINPVQCQINLPPGQYNVLYNTAAGQASTPVTAQDGATNNCTL